jgi:hypothetical protein
VEQRCCRTSVQRMARSCKCTTCMAECKSYSQEPTLDQGSRGGALPCRRSGCTGRASADPEAPIATCSKGRWREQRAPRWTEHPARSFPFPTTGGRTPKLALTHPLSLPVGRQQPGSNRCAHGTRIAAPYVNRWLECTATARSACPRPIGVTHPNWMRG